MELAHGLNWIAVLVAAVANMLIGATWYMPAVFGRQWMRYTGKTMDDLENTPRPWIGYIGSFAASILIAYTVSRIAAYAAAESLVDAILLMLFIWLGLFVTSLSDEALWERRPFGLYILNCGRWLVALIAVTLIVVLWQ